MAWGRVRYALRSHSHTSVNAVMSLWASLGGALRLLVGLCAFRALLGAASELQLELVSVVSVESYEHVSIALYCQSIDI